MISRPLTGWCRPGKGLATWPQVTTISEATTKLAEVVQRLEQKMNAPAAGHLGAPMPLDLARSSSSPQGEQRRTGDGENQPKSHKNLCKNMKNNNNDLRPVLKRNSPFSTPSRLFRAWSGHPQVVRGGLPSCRECDEPEDLSVTRRGPENDFNSNRTPRQAF